ncbi:Nucleolar 27s pre-rrna processing, urb2/npa2, c-terminal, partial [Globisporangium splendens]
MTAVVAASSSAFPWGETLALVCWRQTRRGCGSDAQLIATGFQLLAPASPLLERAEREFNVTWHRIVAEVVHFAIFLITKAKKDEQQRPEQTHHALRLLRLSLTLFATRNHSEAMSIPTNSCNLLLAAMTDVLAGVGIKHQQDGAELDVLLDVKCMYKPPTNVFTDFMHRALTTCLARLAKEGVAGKTRQEYVVLVRAIFVVFQELQRPQMNKKKVFLAIAKTSLRDSIGHRHALAQLQTRQPSTEITAIVDLLDRIVVDALFDAEHIREYDGALVHSSIWRQADPSDAAGNVESVASKTKKRRKNDGASALVSYQKNLFDEIKAFLSDPAVPLDLRSSVGGFMEVFVGAFALRIRAAAHMKIEDTKTDLKTSKKRAATVIATASTTYSPFKFWLELCVVSFLAFQERHAADAASTVALLTKLYKSLFNALCEADIYRVTEDTEDRGQFEAMESILAAFLKLVNQQGCQPDGTQDEASILLVQEHCQIISSAVRCSPNLVNSSLVSIFSILGDHFMTCKQNAAVFTAVVCAGSECLVDLVRSYKSMRLLDKFLKSSMSTHSSKRVSEGVYALSSHSLSESVLRRAFMTLPPGQLEVLWTLFTNEFHSKYNGEDDDVFSMCLVRFVFQIFLQEVHATPQNKTKVASLISKTHETLFTPIAAKLTSSKKSVSFSAGERELFDLFGELLSFYDVMTPAIRADTFDVILAALRKGSLVHAMKELLHMGTQVVKKSKHALPTKIDRRDSTGIIKLCAFWLRKSASIRKDSPVTRISESELSSVALLVVEHVIESKCWDAVAFYLPELLEVVSEEKAELLLKVLVTEYLDEEISGAVDGAASRIVRDAAFYEIQTFKVVAPRVLASLATDFKSVSHLEKTIRLFGFLSHLPETYLDAAQCGELLVNAFAVHASLVQAKDVNSDVEEALRVLFAWLQGAFKHIAVAVYKANDDAMRKSIDNGARFVFSQLAVGSSNADGTEKIGTPLLGGILSFCLDETVGAGAFAGELFRGLISKKAATETNLFRNALEVEALADLRLSGEKAVVRKVGDEETKFIDALLSLVDAECSREVPCCDPLDSQQQRQKSQESKQSQGQRLQLVLSTRMGTVLTESMKAVVGQEQRSSRDAWAFYSSFCQHYPAFLPSVSLETYGCLLVVALSLVLNRERCPEDVAQANKALVANANKDEYRLLLATVAKEIQAPEWNRSVSALKALYLLLQGDRKLTASRRQHLDELKESIVGSLVQNFSRSLATTLASESDAAMASERAELCTWNLQVFVLFYTKAELFTWKTHELAHIFIGFQPLIATAAHWRDHFFSASQLHQVWMLSYTLVLRIVRHHFASLVNGTPHMIQATNALLRLLVVASTDEGMHARGFDASHCVEWSSNLVRLYGYMKEHDAQLRKHVVYLMLTYLSSVTRDNLSVSLQQKLRPGVFSLLDICSTYEKEQLYAALDSTGKSLLESLDMSYKLTHRYGDKV